MNTDLRKKTNNDFEKDFFKLMNNSVFGKTMENVRNHRDIKIVTTYRQRMKFASEPDYHTTKYISEDLLIMEMKKVEVKMNKPIYLGQAILDISKTLMYEFWYDYLKPKYGDNGRLCYTDTDSFYKDFYKDIADDVDKWFDTSKYKKDDNKPLPIGINENVLGKFKDGPKGKIMTEFIALRVKAYAYLLDDDSELKKAKGTKKCIIKRELTFKSYKDSLLNNEIVIKSQHRFRSDHHKVYTEEVNKIALSSNDDKRIQTFDRITTYPYGTNAFKVCENEMRYVILKKIIKLLTLVKEKSRNKRMIKKESIFKNESQALRNESQALRNESQETLNNESQHTNESPQTNESQQTNESRAFKKEQHKKMINTIKMIIKNLHVKIQ